MISDNDDSSVLRPFLDVFLVIVCVLLAMIALLHVSTESTEQAVKSNIVYKVILTWPAEEFSEGDQYEGGTPGQKCDIDLWVKDPDNHVCGFKRREGGDGSFLNLTHDDVGTNQKADIAEHIEVINLRGTVAGEYVVNCHYYAKRTKSASVEVTAKLVKLKPYKEVIERKVKIFETGDERTLFRFSLDKDANVVDTNELPTNIAIQ